MRVLFAAFSRSSLGHVTRMRTAAARFAAAGHDVAVAVHEQARPLVERAGLEWIGIEEIGPAPAWRGMADEAGLRAFARTRLASPAYIEQSIADELRAIDAFAPDAVVSDMRNTASVAASMRGLPAFTVHNLRLFRHPMHAVLPEILAALDGLGLPLAHARKVLGDAVLVPDLPVLDPITDIPPATATLVAGLAPEIRHIGPLVPDALREGPADRPPLLNITLGGSGVGEDDLVRIVAAASGLGAPIAVTLGTEGPGTEDLAARLKAAAAGADIDVAAFRHDAADLMARATAAVVHGGHASMLEGLLTATPLVFVPHSEEQRGNAARVAALGLGETADPSDPETLTAAMRNALDAPRIAHRDFAAILHAADGAAAMIEVVTRAVALARLTRTAPKA
ncbi:glycosyltransferase [Glycomyces sp. NPDC046736]|uniref:glycosyltransferase n=1 Tax=Glycomyces sp. NPDC046736 TaxID=3155615 RepID=UPI0033EDF24B